eukprot:4233642-Prymnesium_polylepis.1
MVWFFAYLSIHSVLRWHRKDAYCPLAPASGPSTLQQHPQQAPLVPASAAPAVSPPTAATAPPKLSVLDLYSGPYSRPD